MSQFERPVIPRHEEGKDTSDHLAPTRRMIFVVFAALVFAGIGAVVLFDTVIDGYFASMEDRRAEDGDETDPSF